MNETSLLPAIFFASVLTVFGHEPEVLHRIERQDGHEALEGHADLGWESRYFLEGRDSLEGDSLFTGSFEMGWECLAGGVWYGYSPDRSYDELQLALAVTRTMGDFEFHGGFTHLRFPSDGTHDNEIGAGAVWSGLPMDVEISAELYYSFDADGCFAEISAGREFQIGDSLTLDLSAPFGINQGYVTDGHDGANHIAFRLGLEYALSGSVSITAHSTYSWALGRDGTLAGDAQLIDFFHAGMGLRWRF